jgi:hypothetical protein
MVGQLKLTLRSGVAAFALDLALIAAIAVAAAYCTWVLFAPRAKAAPELIPQARPQEAASPAAQRIFGSALPQDAPGAPGSAARLVGVLAPGRALFILENGRPRAAAVGESVGELVVREVHPDHVVMSRGGALERLSLERRRAPVNPPPGARGDAGR